MFSQMSDVIRVQNSLIACTPVRSVLAEWCVLCCLYYLCYGGSAVVMKSLAG